MFIDINLIENKLNDYQINEYLNTYMELNILSMISFL